MDSLITLVIICLCILVLVLAAGSITALALLIHKQQKLLDEESMRIVAIASEALTQRQLTLQDVYDLKEQLQGIHSEQPSPEPQPGIDDKPFDPHETD